MSPTLQTLMLHDTGGAGLTRAHSGSTLGHSGGRGLGGSSGPNGGQPGQPAGSGERGGTPVEFDPSQMEGTYALDLERPWDAWVRGSMIYIDGSKPSYVWRKYMHIYVCVCVCVLAPLHMHACMHTYICICIYQVGRRLVQEGTQRWTGVKMDGTPTTKHKKWSEPEHLPAK